MYLSLSDSSTKLHRLQPIRTEEANDDGEEDLEKLDAMEGESEEEFELQPVSLTEKSTKKSTKNKKKKVEETTKRKKRKSEENVDELTVKKSKKSAKSKKKDSKTTTKEMKKSGKKKIPSTFKDEVKSLNVSVNTNGDTTGNTAQTNFSMDASENSENTINHGGKHVEKEATNETVNSKSKDIRVDPNKIFRIEDHGNEGQDVESDSLQQKRIDIQQAFANDDVVEEFIQEKKEIEEASKPKDVDLSLPGWGSWAGAGIKPSEKKKRFIKKADPAPPRKDKNLSHVIINEEKSKLFSKNQVWSGVSFVKC